MAADTAALARTVASSSDDRLLRRCLVEASEAVRGCGILDRLALMGAAVAAAVGAGSKTALRQVAEHRSDLVRQWGPYAVNHLSASLTLPQRLSATLPFAADLHMSVRECAWMAFRPHLSAALDEGLVLLEPVSRSTCPNERRFAVEVCRPRSVWGRHIEPLKRDPGKALILLENVRDDDSRYVRLAAGNWLNDASKTRPDWVRQVCARWAASGRKNTAAIVNRALRTLVRNEDEGPLFNSKSTSRLGDPVGSTGGIA